MALGAKRTPQHEREDGSRGHPEDRACPAAAPARFAGPATGPARTPVVGLLHGVGHGEPLPGSETRQWVTVSLRRSPCQRDRWWQFPACASSAWDDTGGAARSADAVAADAGGQRGPRRWSGPAPGDSQYPVVVGRKEPRPAAVADVHDLALAMPHVTVHPGTGRRPVYQVGGKSFVFFRNPRADAFDPDTGERYDDVIVFWVPGEDDKHALVQDPGTPFFTTPHFDGHLSVLCRAGRLGELTRRELAEIVEDAWLSRASARRRDAWLREHRPG